MINPIKSSKMSRDWKGGTSSTFKTIGASNHCGHERQAEDYYATEFLATDLLCEIERFQNPILESSCGEGLQGASIDTVVQLAVFKAFCAVLYIQTSDYTHLAVKVS